MKPFRPCLAFLVIVGFLAFLARAGEPGAKPPRPAKLRHVVLFKFKDGTTPEQVKAIERAFLALPSKIPEIVDFEWGTNNSPENLAQGYTHCFLLTFRNAEARAKYLPHPEHKKFGEMLHPHLDKVLVIDYFGKKVSGTINDTGKDIL